MGKVRLIPLTVPRYPVFFSRFPLEENRDFPVRIEPQ